MTGTAEGDPFFIDRQTLRHVLSRVVSSEQPNLRRSAYAAGLLAAHGLVSGAVRLGRRVDELLFAGYRDRQVEAPVFIVAIPRSGTTFLHRLMSLDDQFAHLKLYHTILPSVSVIRLVHALAEFDGRLGGVLGRAVRLIEGAAFGGWDGIHRLGFARAEEDEGLFVLTLLTPAMYLLLHEIDEVPIPGFVDRAPDEVRERLVRFYQDSIQRIFEAERYSGTLLEKSVLIGGRLDTMRQVYPDARFVHLVRHPYRSLPSFVSMFGTAWDAVSPALAEEGPERRRLADLAIAYYRRLHEERAKLGPDRMLTIRFDELVGDPEDTLEQIYDWLDRPLSDTFRAAVRRELDRPATGGGSHDYSLEQFGLTKTYIADQLPEVFDAYGFDR